MQPRPRMSGRGPEWRNLLDDLVAARATWSLVGVLLAVQTGLALAGGFAAVPEVYRDLGLSAVGVRQGKVWQLVTHGFVHGNWLHFGLNAMALLALGPRLERIGGVTLWWRLMLAGLLAGGAMDLLAGGDGGRPLVGSSGAVMAALLWLTGVSPGSRLWPLPISGKSLGLGMLFASALLTLANPELGIPGMAAWGRALGEPAAGAVFAVSHACHLGGAVAGWMGARWTLRPRVTLARLQRERRRREG